MSAEQFVNSALRQLQALATAARGFSLNKRFLNLNIFIGVLLAVILLQTFVISRFRALAAVASTGHPLLLLKNEVYASHYDTLLKKYNGEDLLAKPFNERCGIFFDTLTSKNHNWKLDDFSTDGHNDNTFTFDEYLQSYKHEHPDQDTTDPKKLEELEESFRKDSHKSNKVNTKIIDYISILRIFNKCFIENSKSSGSALDHIKGYLPGGDDDDEANGGQKQDLCFDTEARIFPWLSNLYPTFKRWDGAVSVGFPDLVDSSMVYDNYEDIKSGNGHVRIEETDGQTFGEKPKVEKRSERKNCFLKKIKNKINGRGYVISASDRQVDELERLALTLRVNGNKLPIQIVHKGDLSEESQKKLIKAFRRPINIKQTKLLEKFDIEQTSDLSFPKQDVWFVNVKQAINEDFAGHFEKYANKLLAYFFNSFEEMILIDTDTVPFVQLDKYIYSYPEYKSKGAYFFHDRQLAGTNSANAVNFYKRLFPSKLDERFFNIPRVSNFTLNNRFIGDLRNHFMESGVVAIDRRRHFSGMLTALQLNFWEPINKPKIHGDKELFWLGLSIAGDEAYSFNSLGAASIGEITPQENKRLPKTTARELCSNHPGHIDGHDNKTLLWINSGMTYCKNFHTAGSDSHKPLYDGRFDEEALKKLYQAETKIRAAIIPPPQEIVSKNSPENPAEGWTDEHKYCASYTWCAYDFIGAGEKEEENGVYVEFPKSDYKWFDFIGNIWMEGLPPAAYTDEKKE